MKLRRLLYPPKCAFCGKLLPEETPEGEELCPECDRLLLRTRSGGKTHGSFFSVCLSPLLYEGRAREGLLRFKFRGHRAAGRCFGRLMADCVLEHMPGEFRLVTWVPISRLRFRNRGFCQSRILAEETAKRLGLPCRPLLRKTRHTPPLSGIRGAEKRRAAVSGAFACRRAAEPYVSGESILLVDDVITSGATLSECSRVLLTAGAERVVCVTLCNAGKGK